MSSFFAPLPLPLMVLYFIGLGLCDERDITLRGLDAVRGCKRVYLEAYTSTLGVDHAKLVRHARQCGAARRDAVDARIIVVPNGATDVAAAAFAAPLRRRRCTSAR